jgi:hypothetical protein
LQPLLSELIDCASFPRPLQLNQKLKRLVDSEGIIVSEKQLAEWFKRICLKCQNVILARPNGNTKTDYRLRICLSSLATEKKAFLVKIMDTTDRVEGNRIFLERVKSLLEAAC